MGNGTISSSHTYKFGNYLLTDTYRSRDLTAVVGAGLILVGAWKEYISGALSAMLDLGKGRGPLDHLFDLKSSYTEEAQ